MSGRQLHLGLEEDTKTNAQPPIQAQFQDVDGLDPEYWWPNTAICRRRWNGNKQAYLNMPYKQRNLK